MAYDEKQGEAELEEEVVFDATRDDAKKCDVVGKHGNYLVVTGNQATFNPTKLNQYLPHVSNTVQYPGSLVVGKDEFGPDNDVVKVSWTIKFTRRNGHVHIGIVGNEMETQVNNIDYMTRNMQGKYYFYCYNGSITSHQAKGSYSGYAGYIETGHMIKMELNVKAGTLSFWSNDKSLGVAFNNIDFNGQNGKKIAYKLAVYMNYGGDGFTIEKHSVWKDNFSCKLPMIDNVDETLSSAKDKLEKDLIKLNEYNNNKKLEIKHLMNISKKIEYCREKANSIGQMLSQFNQSLDKLEKENSKHLKPNVAKYTQWGTNEIILWIMSLDNGKFAKYANTLAQNIDRKEITGEDLPDLTRQDLDVSLGISSFKDCKALEKYCKGLKEQEGVKSTDL